MRIFMKTEVVSRGGGNFIFRQIQYSKSSTYMDHLFQRFLCKSKIV